MKLRRPPDVLVLLAYTAAATLLSFPLALRFTDSIPGIQGDVWSYFWAMGWARVSMLDLGVNPFRSDYVFYPLGGATQLLWGTALPTFASLPLQLAFGLVPAFNLLYLAATVFTAYGTYLLVEYVLASTRPPNAVDERSSPPRPAIWPGAFVAGLAFAFCALRLGYGLAFTNLFHTELVPFYILFLLKSPSSLKNAVLAGIVLGLNAYIDFQIAAFLVLFTALWLGFSSLGWIY